MRWQISPFIFCDQQQTLSSEDGVIQLEPMMVELLGYFCQHPDSIVSKDQLIEQVWLGRVVNDNTVSKLVTKLRKAFGDDAKQPKFIATFPKKGYKFIASVTPLPEQEAIAVASNGQNIDVSVVSDATAPNPQQLEKDQAPDRTKPLWPGFVVILLILLVMWGLQPSEPKTVVATYAKALTTDAGDELFPAVSPDGTTVAYMLAEDRKMRLMLKDMQSAQTIEIKHEGLGSGPADWSQDGQWLVYLSADPQRCQYYLRPIKGMTLGEPKLIHNCPAGSFGKIIFTHDDHRFVFSQTEGGGAPYELYELNLKTDKVTRLNQPEPYLGGNSQFDLHPQHNKLLISSPNKELWEGFYSLDLDSGQLQLLFEQDAYICCGIFGHDGNSVVLMGKYPAFELLSYDMQGNNPTVIYSGSRKIRWPARHSNGRDYLFSSGEDNYNISHLDLQSNKLTVVANGSVDEWLATFSPDSKRVAYVSVTTGTEEIWLSDNQGQQHTKLTRFGDSRHYLDLVWSPDGSSLAAVALNELHLIDVSTGDFRRLKIPQSQIRGVSFKDQSTLAFSIQRNNQWQLSWYELQTDTLVPQDSRWQFVQYHADSENSLWLDRQNRLYYGNSAKEVTQSSVPAERLLDGRQFNLKKRGHQWFWFEREAGGKIKRFDQASDETTGQTTTLVVTEASRFDIGDGQLLFGSVVQHNADIYQIQVPDSH